MGRTISRKDRAQGAAGQGSTLLEHSAAREQAGPGYPCSDGTLRAGLLCPLTPNVLRA